ncbi:MAG TPA: class I SAM-dependent methyltransferase [Patescibacteria group bacterium]|nr:class I SAM-dependent methyltransferase [Patescibacteria group bacterium]
MELKKPLPPDRTLDQVRNHYLVEKEIASRLKKANREQRKEIYRTMYDELFYRVPDHPRLKRGQSRDRIALSNRKKLAVIGNFINESTVLAEFAPGDCRFAVEIAGRADRVYAIDISDQRDRIESLPANLRLIVYDGYELDMEDECVDVVFSDHLIEHIHPQDTMLHFKLAWRILKRGGVYIFRTPHAYAGPHDISGYFSDEPEGFHIKEWTYGELKRMISNAAYRRFLTFGNRRDIVIRVPYRLLSLYEGVLDLLPARTAKRISASLLPVICAAAVK